MALSGTASRKFGCHGYPFFIDLQSDNLSVVSANEGERIVKSKLAAGE